MGFFGNIFRDKSRDNEFCGLCYEGKVNEVKEALSSWASVRAVSNDNTPAIFYAIDNVRKVGILEALINAGANLEKRNLCDATPLIAASNFDNNVDIINTLLYAGANPNAIMKQKESPNGRTKVILLNSLIISMQNRTTKNLEALLEGKANPNQRLHDNTTPLMFAAITNLPDVIDALGIYGADMNARDRQGFTALDLALHFGKEEAAELL